MTSLNDCGSIVKGSHLFIRQDKQMVMALFFILLSLLYSVSTLKNKLYLYFFLLLDQFERSDIKIRQFIDDILLTVLGVT